MWIDCASNIEPRPLYIHNYRKLSLDISVNDYTLESLCTRTAQSSRGVRSRRVHKLFYFGLL